MTAPLEVAVPRPSSPRRLRRRRARPPLSQRWLWILPFFILYAMVAWPQARILHILSVLFALLILVWAMKWPGRALIFLVVFLPLQSIGFGFLLRFHVPAEVLRPGGAFKEVMGLGILATALNALYKGEERLDGLDKALLAYVAVTTLYVAIPHLFTTLPVTNKWSARLLSWRADCGYPLIFFAVRHAPIPPETRRRFIRTVLIMGGITVAFALFQWARPDQWSHFVLKSGRQVQYQVSVLGNDYSTVTRNLAYLTTRNPLRVSSILLSPFDMADYLLITLAVAVEYIARRGSSWWTYLMAAGILAALFASRVRADSLAAVILIVVALLPAPKRTTTARLRLLAAIGVALIVIVPSLGGTRFTNGQGGAASNQGHIREIRAGLTELSTYPLGLGIGNVAGVGDRFVLSSKQQGGFTTDNSILQVSGELGVQALLPWLLMVVLTWRALGRASRRGDAFAGGVRLAFLGVLVAGMYHHVFLSFAVPWTLWAAAGLALKWPADEGAPTAADAGSNITEPRLVTGLS